jgi:diguanylate cyclase (GGDEF)-like protein
VPFDHDRQVKHPPEWDSWSRIVLKYLLVVSFILLVLAFRWIRCLRVRLGVAVRESRTDSLTGLPNRRAAMAMLADPAPNLVGLMDLDAFKLVNDRHGHDVGDRLLVAIAARLSTTMSGRGSVARLSGDEFLLTWRERPADPMVEAARVLMSVGEPVILDGHTLTPVASLGLAQPGSNLRGPDLLAAADDAMYKAKNSPQHDGGTGTSPGSVSVRVHLYSSPCLPPPRDRNPDRRATRAQTESATGEDIGGQH